MIEVYLLTVLIIKHKENLSLLEVNVFETFAFIAEVLQMQLLSYDNIFLSMIEMMIKLTNNRTSFFIA